MDYTKPVLTRVAATNQPHCRLQKHELSLVEIEGEEFIRTPLYVLGRYKYGKEVLNFDKSFTETVIQNHNERVWDSAPCLRIGHRPNASMAWFDGDLGGRLAMEEVSGDTVFVAYGKPTSKKYRDKIANKEYRYASVDLALNYNSNVIEFLKLEEFVEDNMDQDEKIVQLEQQLALQKAEQEKLLQENQKRDAELAELRNLVHQREVQLEQTRVENFVNKLRNYRDSKGFGYAETLITLAQKLVSGEKVEAGNRVLTLEAGNEVGYFKDALVILLLESDLRGSVDYNVYTTADDKKLGTKENKEAYTKADYASAWEGV